MVLKHIPYQFTILLGGLLTLYSSQFLSAQILNYSSTAYPSTSWINNPTQMANGTTDLAFLTPILLSGNDGPRFICGFFCNTDRSSCLFGVLIFQNSHSPARENTMMQFPKLVWVANRNHPVQLNTTLQLRQDGDLVVADSDGTVVWSSNTRGKPVSGLNLTEMGNLVLFGRNNETIWQSFDHPTDSLLLGQKLVPGQKLIASVSESNLSQGLLSLSFNHHDGLVAYVDSSNSPQIYYMSGFNGENPLVEFNNGSFYGWDIPPTSVAQFMKFEPDGHLRVYQWAGINWREVADLLRTEAGDCGYPMVCGRYGVCTNGQCGCPDAAKYQSSFFRQMDFRHPNLGCSPVTPISCDYAKDHILLELNNTYYFAFDSSLNEQRTELEDCKNTCLSNCSCKAAVFVHHQWVNSYACNASQSNCSRTIMRSNGTSKGSCLLLNEVFSIINNDNYAVSIWGDSSLFIKVQSSYVEKPKRTKVILASTLGTLFAVLCIVGICFVVMRKRLKESNETEVDFLGQVPGMPTRYSYEMLKALTEDFSRKLGEGGFGCVYEGIIENGTKIAVKCIDGFGQVKDSFLVEVKTIGSIHHVNLVKLIGYCSEKSHRLLVYEYMANGSLDTWIFGGKRNLPLPWHVRRKIILDIAKGLAYLHEDCSQKIIHFDIKPQNILLDSNFNAKVSDFGLSKLLEKDQSRIVTKMRGTPGYLAPEWLSNIITEKVDVYSFGIVIMEIICGRKNLDWSMTEENRHLLSLFKIKAAEEKLQDMVDQKSEDMLINIEEVLDMMSIAAWCLQSDFTKRPSMSLVVKVLEGLVAAETNLDYDFTYSSVISTFTGADQEQQVVDDAATPLLPSILSGPR
ncbi:hypothetical protein ACH5RR_028454 [Cinchona calisaya]|uniref:Receptor-like serine/threonine-protein kinase n=1 Tax=Cinchona calisaya TaxID=153742 RepID=A0ABD2YNV7_9GENT